LSVKTLQNEKQIVSVKRCASFTVEQWLDFNWKQAAKLVFSLQRRIAEAVKQNRYNKVKVLQRILVNSKSAKALAVKQVTQNKGKRTAGIDKKLWNKTYQKANAVGTLTTVGYKSLPLRRIHILKKNGKTRPLGIPTMKDRAMQSLFKMALEPISETLADTCSHGFRMYRSCHDAVANLFQILCRKNSPVFILEADIKGCFDNISHTWIKDNIPLDKKVLTTWLKSGFIEKQKLFPTHAGTPQGGIISPVLANMTLDGLQKHIYQAVGINFSPTKRILKNKYQIHLVRYADDFIVTANNAEILQSKIIPAIDEFLSIRGLELSSEKTVITNINKGFNFLGFNFKKYNEKLLIKPSKQSIKSVKSKIADITQKLSSAKTDEYITTTNSVLRGWGYYFRTVVAKETYTKIDSFMFNRIVRWCKRRHPRKQWYWIKQKYFQTIEKSNWVFTGEKQNIFKLSKIQIRRQIKIVGTANPFTDIEYFAERKLRKTYAACSNII